MKNNWDSKERRIVAKYREQGYMTSGDIARKYNVDFKTAARRMGKPCLIVRAGNSVRLWDLKKVLMQFEDCHAGQ